MNVNWRFCSSLFKHGLSFQAAFVLKARLTVLFILPWHNEQTGEGGRLADRALIRISRGFDKQGERDISCLQFLIEVLRVTAPVLSWWRALTLVATKKPLTVIKAHVAMSEVSLLNSLLKSENITLCHGFLHCLVSFVFTQLSSGLFLHMAPVVENSLTSLRIPHTSLPPLGIHCETEI